MKDLALGVLMVSVPLVGLGYYFFRHVQWRMEVVKVMLEGVLIGIGMIVFCLSIIYGALLIARSSA